MGKAKAWIAGAAAAMVLVGCGGGGNIDHKAATTPTSAPAPAASDLQPNAEVTQQLITNLMNQITQATSANGQPKAITPEEAEAMLRQQLQQLGINPSK
jgi:hypothetical protein